MNDLFWSEVVEPGVGSVINLEEGYQYVIHQIALETDVKKDKKGETFKLWLERGDLPKLLLATLSDERPQFVGHFSFHYADETIHLESTGNRKFYVSGSKEFIEDEDEEGMSGEEDEEGMELDEEIDEDDFEGAMSADLDDDPETLKKLLRSLGAKEKSSFKEEDDEELDSDDEEAPVISLPKGAKGVVEFKPKKDTQKKEEKYRVGKGVNPVNKKDKKKKKKEEKKQEN
eukprot:TRINITY_DN2752_c1_g1_i1.p1 TRINITY_DN2752_c1_g1~~TRINITY_DN2752_c1_g1_i1.p1  ORF type:complete len:230 (+),score=126.02 TRINITY_DN2752_c1_g1_i1:63-752(+)